VQNLLLVASEGILSMHDNGDLHEITLREARLPDGRARRRSRKQRWIDRPRHLVGQWIANSLFRNCQALVSAGAGLVFNAARVPAWLLATAS
jgi:hypothetical protein